MKLNTYYAMYVFNYSDFILAPFQNPDSRGNDNEIPLLRVSLLFFFLFFSRKREKITRFPRFSLSVAQLISFSQY